MGVAMGGQGELQWCNAPFLHGRYVVGLPLYRGPAVAACRFFAMLMISRPGNASAPTQPRTCSLRLG